MPEKEIPIVARSVLMKRLVMSMGGRAAEKIMFDEYSAGAAGDIAQATRIARHMVAHWGMSEKVGPVSFKQSEEHPFLGKEMQHAREFSDETARIIDTEVQDILKEANQTAIDMLNHYRDKLDALAEALLEHEDIESAGIREILGPRPGEKDKPAEDSDAKSDAPAADANANDEVDAGESATDDSDSVDSSESEGTDSE